MKLDLYLLGAVGAFGVLGLISGAIKQSAQWLALAVAYLAAKPVAAAAAPALSARLGLPGAIGAPAVAVGLVFLAYLAAYLACRAAASRLLPEFAASRGNRLAGGGLGAAKGAAAIFIVLCVLLSFENPLARAGWDLRAATDGSRAIAFARRHNLFDALKLPAIEAAKRLAAAQTDPRASQAMLADPALRAMLEDPQLKAALADPALQEALRTGDPAALLKNPLIQKILNDPELFKKLEGLSRPPER